MADHSAQSQATTNTKSFYAVAVGRKKGVFIASSQREYNLHLRDLTNGVAGNIHKRFDSLPEALNFLKQHGVSATGVFDKDFNRLDVFALNIGNSPVRMERPPWPINSLSPDACEICNIVVGNDDNHPQCDVCDRWCHLGCVSLSSSEIPDDEHVRRDGRQTQ